jgi:hypothetical protein
MCNTVSLFTYWILWCLKPEMITKWNNMGQLVANLKQEQNPLDI